MSGLLHIFGGSKIRFVFVTSIFVGHNVYYLGLTSQQRRKLRLKKQGIDRSILLAVMGWQIRKDFRRYIFLKFTCLVQVSPRTHSLVSFVNSLENFVEGTHEYEDQLEKFHEKTADRILKAG